MRIGQGDRSTERKTLRKDRNKTWEQPSRETRLAGREAQADPKKSSCRTFRSILEGLSWTTLSSTSARLLSQKYVVFRVCGCKITGSSRNVRVGSCGLALLVLCLVPALSRQEDSKERLQVGRHHLAAEPHSCWSSTSVKNRVVRRCVCFSFLFFLKSFLPTEDLTATVSMKSPTKASTSLESVLRAAAQGATGCLTWLRRVVVTWSLHVVAKSPKRSPQTLLPNMWSHDLVKDNLTN